MGAIKTEVARHPLAAYPATSLLALVYSNIAQLPFRCEEAETPAAQAAAGSVEPPRPSLRFAVDREKGRVVFGAGICLKGSAFRLFHELLGEFDESRGGNRAPHAFRYIQAEKLAERLDVDEQTLRRHVSRTRAQLRSDFLEHVGRALDEQEVIENRRGRGYRLNPFLIPEPLAFLEHRDAA
jgi:hypothetical protein